MALDQKFFDGLHIDVVKKKYYNAGKVNALLEEIRREAEAMTAENAALRERLAALEKAAEGRQPDGEETLARARKAAEELLSDARRRSDRMLADSRRQISRAVERAARSMARIRRQHQRTIDEIDDEWTLFLQALSPCLSGGEEPLLLPEGGKRPLRAKVVRRAEKREPEPQQIREAAQEPPAEPETVPPSQSAPEETADNNELEGLLRELLGAETAD